MEKFDYIIIGAGSSGCALAKGLTENATNTVLLLEAGPHADRFWVNTPAGMAKLFFHDVLNWNYYTEPMARLKGRKMYWPRGKLLGGSSPINGMVFIRGHPSDFDPWRDLGNPGWGYQDVLPYFKAMEHFERRSDVWRGQGGPLWISDPVVKEPASYDFIETCKRLGHLETEDMNGEQHDGVGFMQHTIKNGRRHSAYRSFVKPILKRSNLTVRTNAHVQRILFDGKTAVGVEVLLDGELHRILAAREVILSGGSINSPQLLMLSGVGPAAEVTRHDIPLILDLPGVGRNLLDHFCVHTGWRSTPGSSYNANLRGLRKYWEGFKYLMAHKGHLALGSSQVAAFVKSSPEEPYADLQISFRPMTFNYFPDGRMEVEDFPGLGVSIFQLRPNAQGTVTLRSPRATDKAVCTPQCMTDAYDIAAMMSGIKQVRQVMNSEPIKSRVVAEEVPGPDVQSDDEIFRFMEETGNTAQHTAGTCKMGKAPMAVVDERLRVRGIERLRVVDASVMPKLTSGNTNAPAIMIGVKGADMICKDAVPRREF